MTTTATQTARDIITDALLDIEAVTMGQAVPDRQAAHALRALNRLMKSWQLMDGAPTFLRASQSLTLTTATSYSLNPVRPIRILDARFKRNGIELTMIPLGRIEWDMLPQKAVTGTPTQFYYDRQKEAALFYIWPQLSAADGETIEITYEREFEDLALNDAVDLPSEWYRVAVKQLAAELAPAYGRPYDPGQADYVLNLALAAGMDGESVYFGR